MIDPLPSSLLAMVNLAVKPFTYGILVVIFGVKIIFVVVQTWLELINTAINVHSSVVRRIITCAVAILTLPFRVMTSLQRERLLEEQLQSLQIELQTLFSYAKELEVRLDRAIRDYRLIESLLEEAEDETDKTVATLEQLEVEVRDLKAENCELKEILNNRHQSIGNYRRAETAEKDHGVSDMIQYWEARNQGTGVSKWKRDDQRKSWPSKSWERGDDVDRRREIALLQSLFSAVLSLLIRVVIWKAEDPCTPLVLALFTVVGISMRSVIQFFSTINDKPASDAVALLSLNCFIFGTLASPTLHSVIS